MNLTSLEYILIVSTILKFNPLFQAVKSLRTKSVKDIAPLTFAAILVIGILWLIYGISISSVPLIVGNAIKLFTSLSVVIIYIIFKDKKNHEKLKNNLLERN